MHIAKRPSALAAALAVLIAAAPAHAAVVGLHFSGVFDDDEYYQIVETPYPYAGYLRYDTAAAPVSINATRATYASTLGFSVNAFNTSPRFTITIQRDGADAILSFVVPYSFQRDEYGVEVFGPRLVNYAGLGLPTDPTLLFGTSFNLTLTHLVPDPFGGGFMGDRDTNSGPGSFASVPEPGTWAMLILGLGSVGVISRLQRRRTQSASA